MSGAEFRGTNPLVALEDCEIDVLINHAALKQRAGETFDAREVWRKRYEQFVTMKTGIRVTEAA